MIECDRREFVRILNGLAALKPGGTITPEALELFWAAMVDWDIAEFRSAASALVRSCEFMPNPFHFEQLRKKRESGAAEHWVEILGAARHGETPHGLNAAAARALRAIGGIERVMMSEREKTHFLERRFCEHYEAMAEAEKAREVLGDDRVARRRLGREGEQPPARVPSASGGEGNSLLRPE